MLDWIKRKPVAVPAEQPLENQGQRPATDERLERMLGRLEGRAHGETVAEVVQPPPSGDNIAPREPTADAPSEIDQPLVSDSGPAVEIAAAPSELAAPASADDSADDTVAPHRGDRTITQRGPGPSAAELLAKGYSFATGPDGKMVIFDTEGNLTDVALPALSADSGGAAQAAAEVVHEIARPPSADSTATSEPAAEASSETAPPLRTRRRTAREPAAEVLQEITPPPTGAKEPGAAVGGSPHMRVIAVASQKGGSGKTTIAAHLAVQAEAVGQGPVVLIDTDPQGSLAEWWHARAADTPHLASVRPEALAANLAELRSYGTALAVIDTPPALTGSIEQVISMADLIIIPVRPSPHDLRAAGGTVELARKAGKPFIFVVNSASPRASITAQAVAALSEHGRVAPVILYQRTEFAGSMIDGRTVMETAASGRSAQEIADLWQCVFAQIGLRVAA